MSLNNTCPACRKEIPVDRRIGNTAACQCGWIKDLSSTAKRRYRLDITSIILIIVGVFITLCFIHIANWNNHSITIIPLKMKQFLSFANTSQLKQIATICKERKKWNCIVGAYNGIYEQDPSQIEILHELGKLHIKLKDNSSAATTYHSYFDRGGNNTDAHYQYAKSLGKTGKVKESILQFQNVLDSQPNTLQTTVVRDYAHMLIANRMWEEAKMVIKDYRKKSKSGELFMEKELKKIDEMYVTASSIKQ